MPLVTGLAARRALAALPIVRVVSRLAALGAFIAIILPVVCCFTRSGARRAFLAVLFSVVRRGTRLGTSHAICRPVVCLCLYCQQVIK